MRVYITLAVILITVLLAGSCKKITYRSYTCLCTQQGGEIDEYGLQADSKPNAVADCYDIQKRVNEHKQSLGEDAKVSCNLK